MIDTHKHKIVDTQGSDELWKLGYRIYRWRGMTSGWYSTDFTSKKAAKKWLKDFQASF